MPNNCFGTVTLYASDDRIKEVFSAIHGKVGIKENPFDFNKIIPMPDNIYKGDIGREELELYGKNNWYDWSIKNWGTKWNSRDTYVSGNSICFWTAWSPCLPIIEAMSKLFPDVIIDYWYEESGDGFCGREVYLSGKQLYTEEADLEEHWIDDDDFEQFGYSEGYQNRRTQITEETSEYKKGTFSTREDRDECVYITEGTFIDYGIDAYSDFISAA